MVFLIQKTQNKDSLALHLKLNELVASSRFASNRLVDVEDLTEEEMEVLKKFYMKLSDLSEEEDSLIISHSIDEAQELHKEKASELKKPKQANQRQPSRNNGSRNRPAQSKHTSIEMVLPAAKDPDAKPKPKRRKPRPKPKSDDPSA